MSKGGATRIAARLAAVQALYQMDVAGKGILETMSEFVYESSQSVGEFTTGGIEMLPWRSWQPFDR